MNCALRPTIDPVNRFPISLRDMDFTVLNKKFNHPVCRLIAKHERPCFGLDSILDKVFRRLLIMCNECSTPSNLVPVDFYFNLLHAPK